MNFWFHPFFISDVDKACSYHNDLISGSDIHMYSEIKLRLKGLSELPYRGSIWREKTAKRSVHLKTIKAEIIYEIFEDTTLIILGLKPHSMADDPWQSR